MIVGLYDGDISDELPFCYNLEIMKLSTYFKKKGEIVKLSNTFSPEIFSEFYLRKDYTVVPFPKDLYKYNNLTYGGIAFSKKYIPMPLEIEKLSPDKTIYARHLMKTISNRNQMEFHKNMSNAQHFRFSLDGNTVWEDYEVQLDKKTHRNGVYLHDYNITNIKDIDLALKDFLKKYSYEKVKVPRAINVKYPIVIDNFEDFKKWVQFYPSDFSFRIQYSGFFTDENIYELAHLNIPFIDRVLNNVRYDITAVPYDENDFLKNYLPKIFNQILFLRSINGFFSLIYDESFFQNEETILFLRTLNFYISFLRKNTKKYYEETIKLRDTNFIKWCKRLREEVLGDYLINIDDARRGINFIGNNNYNFAKNFYNINRILYDDKEGFYFDTKSNPFGDYTIL